MIIDLHVHLGVDVVFDKEIDEPELLRHYKKHTVDGGIVQPYLCRPYLEDTRQIHDRIHAFTKTTERKFWGMASINPHFRPEDYDAEAFRCIRELGFVGIKITSLGHACHPSSRDALHVFEVCRGLGVPLMIHTGAGIPFADPMSVEKALESFPGVTVVLAHAGSEMHNQQATYLARKWDNVYLEPSWVGAVGVQNMIREVGCGKILFSSDSVYQIPVELAKYRALIDDPDELDKVLYKNAVSIYRLKL